MFAHYTPTIGILHLTLGRRATRSREVINLFSDGKQTIFVIFLVHLPCFWQPGKTHYKPITYCYYFLSDNQFVASHRSHESHKERIVTLAFAIRLKTLGEADKLRALCDAASVRFVRSV